MSAVLSPIFGIIIDLFNKRSLLIVVSSILIVFSCFFSALVPNSATPNFICLVPEILIGFGYSIYASALYSAIPLIVLPKTIGTAFGLLTSI
jgi:MFS family permease